MSAKQLCTLMTQPLQTVIQTRFCCQFWLHLLDMRLFYEVVCIVLYVWPKMVFKMSQALLPIKQNCGAVTHRFGFWVSNLVFYAQSTITVISGRRHTDPCIILMHTYFQSGQDSRQSFSTLTKPDQQGSECKTLLATFLSVMPLSLIHIWRCRRWP